MYAIKDANMRKPIRLYTPEHATSIEKGIVVLLGLVIIIVGLAYSLERVDGTPRAFTMKNEASELITDNVEPSHERIGDGGGIRKMRNVIGKISCLSVCGLKMIRINPAVNIGKADIWISIGVNV
jgi:hypothetical protein